MKVENFAPDSDTILLTTDTNDEIVISRDEQGEVFVALTMQDGTEHRMVLGSESETTKL